LKPSETPDKKIWLPQALAEQVHQWKTTGKKVVFTNGCFDLLHPGHIYSLLQASAEGDYLVVGVNADRSVKQLKGSHRPVNNERARALVVASLAMVDAVCIFAEDTPLSLIRLLLPDVLVKGGDYTVDQIAGAKEVIAAGGKVVLNPLLSGFSTTSIIQKLSAG
jgi:D-beta-D-heptose 7-phosphate kinase/D-beta-D-heptose 1-phosphate adenosyltransferase